MGELVGFVLLDNTKFLTNFTHYLFKKRNYLPATNFSYGFTNLTNLRIKTTTF
jgi:hypothetical protein